MKSIFYSDQLSDLRPNPHNAQAKTYPNHDKHTVIRTTPVSKAIKFSGNSGDFSGIALKSAARGDLDDVKTVLKKRPDWLNRIGPHGRTLLWEASHRGRGDVIKYLLARGANINACGTYYTPYFLEVSCLCISLHKKHKLASDLLFAAGARLDIHNLAFLGDFATVKNAIQCNKKLLHECHPQTGMLPKEHPGNQDYSIQPNQWATPLVYALKSGSLDLVNFLIKRGSNVKGNDSALFDAADDNPDLVEALLENGADPAFAPRPGPDDEKLFQVVTKYGVQPASSAELSAELVYLCRGDRGGNPAEVRRMVKQGANVNHQDHKSRTALHRAAKAGFVKTIEVLLELGADASATDVNGDTALHDAVRSTIRDKKRKNESISLLIKTGMSSVTTNKKGLSPIDLARTLPAAETLKVMKLMNKMPRRHK